MIMVVVWQDPATRIQQNDESASLVALERDPIACILTTTTLFLLET